MVAVTAQNLRKQGATVATVFIQPQARWNQGTVDSILDCVYRQLVPISDEDTNFDSGCQELSTFRTERLHQAVTRRLADGSSAIFLLLDGSDSADVHFHNDLEQELSSLQKLGLKVLVTSRRMCGLTDAFFASSDCDFCDAVDLEVYWECPKGHFACDDCYYRIKGVCVFSDEESSW